MLAQRPKMRKAAVLAVLLTLGSAASAQDVGSWLKLAQQSSANQEARLDALGEIERYVCDHRQNWDVENPGLAAFLLDSTDQSRENDARLRQEAANLARWIHSEAAIETLSERADASSANADAEPSVRTALLKSLLISLGRGDAAGRGLGPKTSKLLAGQLNADVQPSPRIRKTCAAILARNARGATILTAQKN